MNFPETLSKISGILPVQLVVLALYLSSKESINTQSISDFFLLNKPLQLINTADTSDYCKKCIREGKSGLPEFKFIQTRSFDEGQTIIKTCTTCGVNL
jgi:DNA-directed RNA polymerase subunit M/transcription elongation factor TFIIS